MIRNTLIVAYILTVLAISAVARAEVVVRNENGFSTSDLQNYDFQKAVGEIVALADGSLAFVSEGRQVMYLQSQMDLTAFIGFKVMISGIELEHQLAPQLEIESVDPLPALVSGNKKVFFFVFNISEVME